MDIQFLRRYSGLGHLVNRSERETSMIDYTATDPAQEARFTAFVRKIEGLIASTEYHANAVAFLGTLDLDATRALRSYAVKADAHALVELIDGTWAAR